MARHFPSHLGCCACYISGRYLVAFASNYFTNSHQGRQGKQNLSKSELHLGVFVSEDVSIDFNNTTANFLYVTNKFL